MGDNRPRRSSVSERPKVSWDDQLKQEEAQNKAIKEGYKKTALQLLKGANAIYNTGVKTDKWQNTLKTTTAVTGATLALLRKDAPKQPDPWYKKAWSGLKKVTGMALKAVTGNVAAIALTTVALVGAVATGGIVPIVGGAVVVGLKAIKTGMDARKANHVRKLNQENDALVDYATQLAVKKQLLKFEPKLKGVEDDLQKIQQGKASDQQLKFGTGTRIAEKVVDTLNRIAEVTIGAAANPVQAATVIGTGVFKFAKDTVIEEITRTPEVREQLRLLINNERKSGNVGYDNIQDLREQTHKLKMDNQALKETMKEIIYEKDGKYSSLSEEQVKTKFKEKQEAVKKETPELQPEKKESTFETVKRSVGDALNPYSEFNIKQQSGLVTGQRKENLSKETLEAEVRPKRSQSISDVNLQEKMTDIQFKEKLDSLKTQANKKPDVNVESKPKTSTLQQNKKGGIKL